MIGRAVATNRRSEPSPWRGSSAGKRRRSSWQFFLPKDGRGAKRKREFGPAHTGRHRLPPAHPRPRVGFFCPPCHPPVRTATLNPRHPPEERPCATSWTG